MPFGYPMKRTSYKKPTTVEGRKAKPKCGATNRQGKPCQNAAGYKTDHVGSGRCYLHGGVGQNPARYADLKARPRLKELIERFSADENPLDLSHELNLLRALVQDYVERYEATTEALLAWHASFNGDFELKLRRWRSDVATWLETFEEERSEPADPFPTPPYPQENKPRQMVDIIAASGFIDKIGAMTERIEKRRAEGSISMATLATVLDDLAFELVNACEEVGIRDAERTRLLTVVDRRWKDARSIPRAALLAPVGVPDRADTLN